MTGLDQRLLAERDTTRAALGKNRRQAAILTAGPPAYLLFRRRYGRPVPRSAERPGPHLRALQQQEPGRFLLIAGEEGEPWYDAARQLAAEADLPLDAVRIGHLDGDLYDPRCTWLRHRQIASDGAVRHGRAPGRPGRRAQPGPRPAGRRAGRIGSLIRPVPLGRASAGTGP